MKQVPTRRLTARRQQLLDELARLGPVLRASVVERFTQCGKGRCLTQVPKISVTGISGGVEMVAQVAGGRAGTARNAPKVDSVRVSDPRNVYSQPLAKCTISRSRPRGRSRSRMNMSRGSNPRSPRVAIAVGPSFVVATARISFGHLIA